MLWKAHSSINRHPNLWSNLNFNKLVKSETRHPVSLGFGLKEAKITSNMVKVGVHSCLPNGHLNLWLSFNSEKLVKSEISLCSFAKVGLKGVENSLEHHKIWCACFSCFSLSFAWKGVKIVCDIMNLVCMLVYQMGIQIYDQISIPRNCYKWNFVARFW